MFQKKKKRTKNQKTKEVIQCTTCKIETKEIADPKMDGGFDNLDFGFAEYAESDAERTFTT